MQEPDRVQQNIDETAYLLHSPANRKHLLEAIAYIDSYKPLINVGFVDVADGAQNIAVTFLRSGATDGAVTGG